VSADGSTLTLAVPPEMVERIAERAAELIAERQPPTGSPWLDTRGAAEHMAATPARVHDLVALGRLMPRRDGRRLLFRREDIDRYLNQPPQAKAR
jgi:hypothetical protein